MNKYLKLLLVFTITSVVVAACATIESKSKQSSSSPQTVAQWHQKYPAVFTNAVYQSLIESSAQLKSLHNLPDSQQELIGTITNPFGIRDDILTFIINYFPNNESATYAAIKIEQTSADIYYLSSSKDAVKIFNDGEIAIWCLAKNVGFDTAGKYLDSLNKVRVSTPEGKLIDQDNRKKLGWKVLGNHLSKEQMNQICDKGSY